MSNKMHETHISVDPKKRPDRKSICTRDVIQATTESKKNELKQRRPALCYRSYLISKTVKHTSKCSMHKEMEKADSHLKSA